MNSGRLTKLEETVTNLAAYLIIAHEKHPKLIVGENEEPVSDSSSMMKLRVSQHYTTALLAYGVPATAPEMTRVTNWFATPFPRDAGDIVDQAEMTRLEGLLNLHPDDASVYPRLKRLIEQQSENGFFEIEREDGQTNPIFDTLWALKVLMLAREKDVSNGLISEEAIQKHIDQIIEIGISDKDLALALRLRYELFGKLTKTQVTRLKDLLQSAKTYGGVWGVSQHKMWSKVENMIDAMHRRELTPGVIGESKTRRRTFRDIILNTCYVIENLSVLVEPYPEIQPVIEDSIELWWRQFQGDNAPNILQTLFPDEYDYLMVMCRTLVTVSSVIGEPLGARFWLRPLREMSLQKFKTREWPEKKSIQRALRRWIGIELANDPESLHLGLSEANVVRIEPMVYNPMDEYKSDLLGETLIVKYGAIEDIETERKNYDQLPYRLHNHFVRLPDASYIDKRRGQAFVIMEDLRHYETLFETYHKLLQPRDSRLADQLAAFLLEMHRGSGIRTHMSTSIHLRDMYLRPMLEYIDRLFKQGDQLHDNDLISDQQYELYQHVHSQVSDLIARIIQHQKHMEHFPLAYMHGDLHSRNIMIRDNKNVPTSTRGSGLDFKLIDLESLRPDGDTALDAGQLIVDLELLKIRSGTYLEDKLTKLQRGLSDAYIGFAGERTDSTFEIRLKLAQARSLLRIGKSWSKRSGQQFIRRDYKKAIDYMEDGVQISRRGGEYLEQVLAEIEA